MLPFFPQFFLTNLLQLHAIQLGKTGWNIIIKTLTEFSAQLRIACNPFVGVLGILENAFRISRFFSTQNEIEANIKDVFNKFVF